MFDADLTAPRERIDCHRDSRWRETPMTKDMMNAANRYSWLAVDDSSGEPPAGPNGRFPLVPN
jgi:hypothetical protein